MTNINKLFLCAIGISSSLMIACATGPKADIASTANPQDEIIKLESDLNAAVSKNVDVLAADEFASGVNWLKEAKSDIAQQKGQDEILEDLRLGRGALESAYKTSGNREAKAPGLFAARQSALSAGAGKQTDLRSDWRSLDFEVAAKAKSLSDVSSDKLAAFQTRYIDLERRAVILTQLGDAQAKLNGARKDKSTDRAAATTKKLEMSLKTAESVISTNVRNPEGFSSAVDQANTDATLLMDVMNTIKQNKGLQEQAALKMVGQNRQINSLKSKNVSADTANMKLTADLADKTEDLTSANAKVEVQRVIEQARRQFSPDEAEAYQQGGKLLIRLKNINFASGRSDLPEASLASLAKVSEVAKSLNASEIKVEGHTDSVGTESQNNVISQDRATAVATYFTSNGFADIKVNSAGYGFSKPIATNKSKSGRAQNRRVDIIITPAAEKTVQ